ncbi:MAG TPA: hypothetical protein VGW12_18460 [Pyrinomonadaceae bacterium]|nr:hypothetical protein [Pyrinomonadaceae bacterium]
MITLDAAMLNVSAAPFFFPDLQEPMRLEVIDESGGKTKVSQFLDLVIVFTADSL